MKKTSNAPSEHGAWNLGKPRSSWPVSPQSPSKPPFLLVILTLHVQPGQRPPQPPPAMHLPTPSTDESQRQSFRPEHQTSAAVPGHLQVTFPQTPQHSACCTLSPFMFCLLTVPAACLLYPSECHLSLSSSQALPPLSSSHPVGCEVLWLIPLAAPASAALLCGCRGAAIVSLRDNLLCPLPVQPPLPKKI